MQRFRSLFLFAGAWVCLFVPLSPLRGGTIYDSFVFSDEGNGFIAQLVNAGYGNLSTYQALVQIRNTTDPSVAGIITPAFMTALQGCSASTQIFNEKLNALNAPGVSLAISTDCTVQTAPTVLGSTYLGQPGTATLVSDISGVGFANFTYSTTSSPLTSWTNTVGNVSSTYNVFAVAYDAPASVPEPSTWWLVLLALGCVGGFRFRVKRSRRRATQLVGVLICLCVPLSPLLGGTIYDTFVFSDEGNGLLAQLINAGYGNYGTYNQLVAIQNSTDPGVTGIITPSFLKVLKACSPSSQIFTEKLKTLYSPGVSLAISTDCTVQTTPTVLGSTYFGQPGTDTLVGVVSGVGLANFTYSTTSSPLTSWTNTVGDVSSTYNVFAVAYDAPPAVPEPSTWWLVLLTLGCLGGFRFRVKRHPRGTALHSLGRAPAGDSH